MQVSEAHQTHLQRLLSDPHWEAVEAAFKLYMLTNFGLPSIKRETEFDTLWYAAEAEGAKRHLQAFMQFLEKQAQRAVPGEEFI